MFFFVILSGSLKSEPGQLIDYTHQSTMTQDEIIFILWFAGFDPVADFGISVYDIKYETEGEGGYIDTLSGLVAFPHSPIEAFPILSYQHGTAVNDASAPSLAGLTMDNPEVLIISLVTAPSGFITLFPDYEGLGDPNKFHPFIIAESYTHSVINMVRAVKQLSAELEGDDQFQFNDQLFLIGYSEGGYATMAVQRGIELNFSDEFTITTSCPMAGPYDVAGTMVDYFLSIPSYPKPFYVPFVLTSHLWYYQGEDVDFGDYFEPFWADTLPSLFDGTHFGDEIDALMPENPLDIILPDVLEEFTNNEDHFFRQTLQQNTLLDWIPMSPTYLYHGIGDDIVPFQNAQIAYDTFVSNGADSVTLTLYPEEMGGHGEVATTCLFAGFDVISDRQAISPKGDLNSDSYITVQDVDLILDSIVHETDLTDFQWWAGDCDYDDQHSVIDLLMVADLID